MDPSEIPSDPKPKHADDAFHQFSSKVAGIVGSSSTFVIALAVVSIWALSGPIFHFSDTWQLVINTGTTIITFLMVFVIQNTQNRDARAVHLKLDELIRATKRARNRFMDLESLSNAELDALEHEFRLHRLKKHAPEDLKKHVIAATTPPTPSDETRRVG